MGARIYIVLAALLLAGCEDFNRRLNCNSQHGFVERIDACLAEQQCRVTSRELQYRDWLKANCPV